MKKRSSTRLLALALSLMMLLSAQSFAFAAQPASEAGSNMEQRGIGAAPEEGSDTVTFIDDADEASGETAFIDDADEASDAAAFFDDEAEEAELQEETAEDETVTITDVDEGMGAAAELEASGAQAEIYGNASPSADPEAEYDESGTGLPADEDATGLNTHDVSGSLKKGSSLTLHFNYTGFTTYDGRKHVLAVNPAKNTAVAPTASQNPDIEVKNFRVLLDGTVITGITLKSCSYKNNTNPGTMQLIPAVNYDSKDPDLNKLLKEHTDLKTVLGKMLNPKYDKKNEEWEYAPVFIGIDQIVLSGDTEVYNLKGKTSAEKKAIAAKDGVLVWNGDGEKISWTTRKVKEEADWNDNGKVTKWITYTYYIPIKVTVPGLYYQRVFDLGKGKTAVKKISLRAGGWSIKKKTYSEDGESWTETWAAASSGTYDYLFEEPDVEGGYLKDKESDERPTYIQPVLNADGQTETRTRMITCKENGETWKEEEVYEEQAANPGFFTGTLPNFDTFR